MDWRLRCYDVTDDNGALLREYYPDSDALPHFVKTAQLSPLGNKWAVCYSDGNYSLNKYATADAGSTWVSSLYFTRTSHSLPSFLRKEAAAKLKIACEGFGVKPPQELESILEGNDARRPIPEKAKLALAEIEQARAAQLEEKEKVATPIAAGINTESLSLGLSQRLLLVPAGNRADVYKEMEKLAMHDPDALVDDLEAMDMRHGFITHWGRIPDAHTTVFGNGLPATDDMEKTAAAPPDKVYQVGNTVVTTGDLRKLASSGLLRATYPKDFIEEFQRDPDDVFSSLPMDTRRSLATMAKDA